MSSVENGKLVFQPFPSDAESLVLPSDISRTEGPGERWVEHIYLSRGLIAKRLGDGKNDIEVFDPVLGKVYFSEVKGLQQRKFRLSRSRKARFLLRDLFVDMFMGAACYVLSSSDYTEFLRDGGEITHKNLELLRNFIEVDDSHFFRAYFEASNIERIVLIDKDNGWCELTTDEACQVMRIYSIGNSLPRIEIKKEYYGFQKRRRSKGVASSTSKPVRKRAVRNTMGRIDSKDLVKTFNGIGRESGSCRCSSDRTSSKEDSSTGGIGGIHLF